MALHESLRFHRANAVEVARAVDDARRDKTRAGVLREGPYYWYGNSEDPTPPPADAILEHPPCGYLLTPDQISTVRPWIDGFNVATIPLVDGTIYVPMGQEAQPVVGLMLDGRSAGSNEVEGVPWPAEPAAGPARCPARGPGG
jgi:hypothetical protein